MFASFLQILNYLKIKNIYFKKWSNTGFPWWASG